MIDFDRVEKGDKIWIIDHRTNTVVKYTVLDKDEEFEPRSICVIESNKYYSSSFYFCETSLTDECSFHTEEEAVIHSVIV